VATSSETSRDQPSATLKPTTLPVRITAAKIQALVAGLSLRAMLNRFVVRFALAATRATL